MAFKVSDEASNLLGYPGVGALGVVPYHKHVSINGCVKAREAWSQIEHPDPVLLDPFHDGR